MRGVASGPSHATPGMSEETVGRVHDHSRWGEEVVDSSVIMHSACPVRKKRGTHRERAALTHECCTAPHREVGTCTHSYIHTVIHSYIRTFIHLYIRTFAHSYIRTFWLKTCALSSLTVPLSEEESVATGCLCVLVPFPPFSSRRCEVDKYSLKKEYSFFPSALCGCSGGLPRGCRNSTATLPMAW